MVYITALRFAEAVQSTAGKVLPEAVQSTAGKVLPEAVQSTADNRLVKSSPPVRKITMAELPPLPSPRELLKLYKIQAMRNLSQNFLLDRRLTNKIVTYSGNIKNCYVCEVGPGPGNITRNIILNGAKEITVVEKDKRFSPILQLLQDVCGDKMKIVWGDIMDFDCQHVFPKEQAADWHMPCPPFYIIGNLPFNVSTPLIIRWLRHMSTRTGPFTYGRTRLTLTFQKEVADRMVARPCSDARCRLSVMCQYLANVTVLFTIPGRAFYPKPEVDVSVVKFTPLIKPMSKLPFSLIEKVARVFFHHRQKRGKFGLECLVPKDCPGLVEQFMSETGFDFNKKPFQFETEEFIEICKIYSRLCDENEGLLHYDFRHPNKPLVPLEESDDEDDVDDILM